MKARSTITRQEAVNRIKTSSGKFTAVVFRKRTTGELRKMVFRTGVTSHLKGGDKPYDAAEHRLITVFDAQKNAYRTIPVEGLLSIKVDGEWLTVEA